ncbi:MAG: tetratricopeptide repeat protein [Sphingomicrobium sp.]
MAAVPIGPVHAARERVPLNTGLAYVEARAAALSGDYARSATLFAALARQSGNEALTRRAISTAISAGDTQLALQLMRGVAVDKLPLEAKLLLVADELRAGRTIRALSIAETPAAEIDISFLGPLVRAWDAAQRKDLAGAIGALAAAPVNGVLAPYRDQHRALILLKFKRSADAVPLVERSLAGTGLRDQRLRFVFADAYLRAGDPQRAAAIVGPIGLDGAIAKARLRSGKPVGQAIENPAAAMSDLLTGIAVSLGGRGDPGLPIALLQVARAADPTNSSAALLLGFLLARDDRPANALAVYRSVADNDPFVAHARQLEAGLLADEKRETEALALAQSRSARRDAGPADHDGLARVLSSMGRNDAAADAYGRAISLAGQDAKSEDLWPLYLNRASALEQAGRWPEAKQALETALRLAPQEPLILNNLGYAKLERGEDLDQAESMIRKASALAPDDASITDSLGWALYKQGRVADSIQLLQQAAVKDPAEPEIREHLGDALYSAGRRYEARFAWNAALVNAEGDSAARVKSKLDSGLTPKTAAP